MGRWSGTRGLGLGRGSVPVNTRHQKEAGSAAGSPGSQGCGSQVVPIRITAASKQLRGRACLANGIFRGL